MVRTNLFHQREEQIASCFKDLLTGKCGSTEHRIQWTRDDRKKGMVVREEEERNDINIITSLSEKEQDGA